MATPCLLAAIQQLDTVLTGINGTGNYTTTVGSVQHISADWTLAADAALPAIGIYVPTVEFVYNPTHIVYGDSEVVLRCLMARPADPLTRLTNQIELLDDIFEALSTTITLNSTVISATVVAADFHPADALNDNEMHVPVLLHYERTSSAT